MTVHTKNKLLDELRKIRFWASHNSVTEQEIIKTLNEVLNEQKQPKRIK